MVQRFQVDWDILTCSSVVLKSGLSEDMQASGYLYGSFTAESNSEAAYPVAG